MKLGRVGESGGEGTVGYGRVHWREGMGRFKSGKGRMERVE